MLNTANMELYAIVSVLLGSSSASTYAPTYAYCPLVLCEGLRQLTQANLYAFSKLMYVLCTLNQYGHH